MEFMQETERNKNMITRENTSTVNTKSKKETYSLKPEVEFFEVLIMVGSTIIASSKWRRSVPSSTHTTDRYTQTKRNE